eukprot:Opistho-1_new@103637
MSIEKETQIVLALKALQKLSRGCSMKELATTLNISNKSAYRYVDSLRSVGFSIEAKEASHIYIIENKNNHWDLNLTFSQEEVDFILKNIPENEDLLKTIKYKLDVHSDLLTIPNNVLEAQFGKNIAILQDAIKNRKQVFLKGYSSANSNVKKDILVEPVDMQDHYRKLYAFDTVKKRLVQFKTERIDIIELKKENHFWSNLKPESIKTDVFWWIKDGNEKNIELKLSLTAYQIIKEEYPRIEKHTKQINATSFILKTEVADFRPVTSLVLRLPEEIKIISPPELELAVIERIKKHDFFSKYFSALS